jgi:hypothetical protein
VTKRTRLYLDVDGVINARYADRAWDGIIHKGNATAEGYSYRILWSPTMLTALSELDLEIVWATTWRNDAPASLARILNFGKDFRVLHPDLDPSARSTFPSIEWKLRSIVADQERDPSPFVWLDDEIDHTESRVASAAGGLALGVDSNFGVGPAHIAVISSYIEAHRERPLDTEADSQ